MATISTSPPPRYEKGEQYSQSWRRHGRFLPGSSKISNLAPLIRLRLPQGELHTPRGGAGRVLLFPLRTRRSRSTASSDESKAGFAVLSRNGAPEGIRTHDPQIRSLVRNRGFLRGFLLSYCNNPTSHSYYPITSYSLSGPVLLLDLEHGAVAPHAASRCAVKHAVLIDQAAGGNSAVNAGPLTARLIAKGMKYRLGTSA
jgi:hypothetical protein